MVLGIVKKSEEDLAGWLATEAGFLSGLCSLDGEPLVLEPYQLAFLANRSRFRWVTKSRQVGFSFLTCKLGRGEMRRVPQDRSFRGLLGYHLGCPRGGFVTILLPGDDGVVITLSLDPCAAMGNERSRFFRR